MSAQCICRSRRQKSFTGSKAACACHSSLRVLRLLVVSPPRASQKSGGTGKSSDSLGAETRAEIIFSPQQPLGPLCVPQIRAGDGVALCLS